MVLERRMGRTRYSSQLSGISNVCSGAQSSIKAFRQGTAVVRLDATIDLDLAQVPPSPPQRLPSCPAASARYTSLCVWFSSSNQYFTSSQSTCRNGKSHPLSMLSILLNFSSSSRQYSHVLQLMRRITSRLSSPCRRPRLYSRTCIGSSSLANQSLLTLPLLCS